ncbi:MAG TPA: bifunctional nicotinamidase/pyrazinamidase [Desulfomonilia bacterium]|nr:bifunctional nicotinamidase/pyrazinamidase [Desulfomonilia bacterium]
MDITDLKLAEKLYLQRGDCLIVVDMQNDFMPGGALPVAEGDSLVPGVNSTMKVFSGSAMPIVLTQDWHPIGHRSFASSHAGKKPFDPHSDPGIGPVLWPDHCVQGTPGADFHHLLDVKLAQAIIRKGFHQDVDSYSGFLENDGTTATGLDGYLKARKVKRIFVCGLALDYCVFFTAGDGSELGYEAVVLIDLAKPVGSPPGSVSQALGALVAKGVAFAKSSGIHI